MENINYTKEDVDRISSIVFKEIRSQFNRKREDTVRQFGKDELYHEIKVEFSNKFYHEEEENVQEIDVEKCAEDVLKCVEEKLIKSGYQIFNGNTYNGREYVAFVVSICGEKLENEDLSVLEKECKRNDKLSYSIVPVMILSLLIMLGSYETVINVIGKEYALVVALTPFWVAIPIAILSGIAPVKWRLRKKYTKLS